MAEAQRLIGISLAKIAQSRVCRGGVSLHKNLLVATVLQKARYIFMEEAYHIVHGHYLQQQQQQQQHHHQLMQEQQNAAYLLAGHCDGSSADSSSNDSCDDECSNSKCGEVDEKPHLHTIGTAQEDELVDPVEEDETSPSSCATIGESLSYDCDSTILPTTIGGLPLEPLNMCRNGDGSSGTEEEDEEEETGPGGDDEEKQTSPPHDVSHLFLLPALAPWIGAAEDNKENVSTGGSFPFLPSVVSSPFDDEEDEEEPEDEEDEEEENTCQDLSCHQRKPAVVEEQTPELVKQFESAVRSKGAMRYFDLDDRRTVGRPERRRRRHRTEGDHQQQQPLDSNSTATPAKRRRSSTTDESKASLAMANSETGNSDPVEDDDRILPIALLSAKRMKTCDSQRPLTPAICSSSSHGNTSPPQFYSSPHETICAGDAETLSECVNQQLEAENLTTTSLPASGAKSPEQQPHTAEQPEHSDTDAPPTPSVESIDRITSLVSIFSFGNLSRSVSTPDFCAAQAQKDSRPDAGGSLLTSQLQHHGQRGYLTMTV
ncbi:protein wings apart-like [Anopheles marshallii]|uniref:protein wings apart-like n=1 Tax=Anopheles marshallii TaxID=1521116 RepID=UPI00237B7A56|nr:protein wings apart-like [Anopheles marshallii]